MKEKKSKKERPRDILYIKDTGDVEVFRIEYNGKLVVNPKYTNDEAAKKFWEIVKELQNSYGLMPKCDTCAFWERCFQYGVDGGFCHSGKMLKGYYLPKMSFTADCLTFAIDLQTDSLYYTGALFGCVHHIFGTDFWKEGVKAEGVEYTEEEKVAMLKDYQDNLPDVNGQGNELEGSVHLRKKPKQKHQTLTEGDKKAGLTPRRDNEN